MHTNLVKNCRFLRNSNAVAAGTTTINGTVVDLEGAREATFQIELGAIVAGGVQSVKLQTGTLANGSDMADVAGGSITIADTDGNKLAILSIFKPTKRYARFVMLRATQNSTLEGCTVILTHLRKMPATLETDVVDRKLVSA